MNGYDVRWLVALIRFAMDLAQTSQIRPEKYGEPAGVFYVLFEGANEPDYIPSFRIDLSNPSEKRAIELVYRGNVPTALPRRHIPLAKPETWEATMKRVLTAWFKNIDGMEFSMKKVE